MHCLSAKVRESMSLLTHQSLPQLSTEHIQRISRGTTRNVGRLTHLGQPEIGDFRCRKPIGQVDCIEQDVFRFQIAMCDTHGMLRERARKHHRQAWRLRIDGLTMYCQSLQKIDISSGPRVSKTQMHSRTCPDRSVWSSRSPPIPLKSRSFLSANLPLDLT